MEKYWTAKISFRKGDSEHKYIVRVYGNSIEVAFIDEHRSYHIDDFNTFKLIKQIKL